MQASSQRWTPPGGTLGDILSETRTRVDAARGRAVELEARARDVDDPPPFARALRRDSVAVIAEIKRRSPSRGTINATLAPDAQAGAYERGGAAAVSVLTEPQRFGGALEDLDRAREGSILPLLRKDFIVDALQVAEARCHGASAVLLIARALPPDRLAELVAAAQAYAIEVLLEVRSEEELDRALALPVSVIGVNSRDLETLEIDAAVSARLLPLIPGDRIAVAESGIATPAHAAEAAHMGADAILVGSSISAAGDPEAAVRALGCVPRVGRARRD